MIAAEVSQARRYARLGRAGLVALAAAALLLAAPALLAGADAALQRRWADAGVVRVPADGQAADALAATGHAAVLLRPDRYVAGVADSVHELAGLADLVDLALPVH